jgi:hypothetical protein
MLYTRRFRYIGKYNKPVGKYVVKNYIKGYNLCECIFFFFGVGSVDLDNSSYFMSEHLTRILLTTIMECHYAG